MVKIPVRRAQLERTALHRRSGSAGVAVTPSNTTISLTDVQDLIYIANVSIGGVSYPVQLDTGSSDLWVLPSSNSLPSAESTSVTLNLTYGTGWASGPVAMAETAVAGITVPQQAFLNVSAAQNPALSYNAQGIMGLGFDSLSNIDAAFNQSGSSSGRTLLYNLFRDNTSEPNFIAFSLQSASDDDGVQGTFSIGETDPQYANVTGTNKIPTWPVASPSRWTVLLDSFVVGNKTVSVSSSISAAPANHAVVLLDSGTTNTYVPTDVSTAIYGGVAGAHYESSLGQWTVPCNAEIDVALQFGNQIFPIDPLDLTPTDTGSSTTCVGSFIPQNSPIDPGQFDWLVGDNVLRSIYTLYDFGDFDSSGNVGNPYVQMLALINPDEASVQFHNVRGGTPNTNITYNVSDSGSGSTSVSLSTQVANAIDNLSNYLPAILGIMALNALVLMVLIVVGIVLLCRRRKNARTRKTPGRLSPIHMGNQAGFRGSEFPGDVPHTHTYQPVSMALTEDTLFAPPSPGFKNYSSSRPNSVA